MKLLALLGFIFLEVQVSGAAAHAIGWGSLLFYFLLAFMAGSSVLRKAVMPLAAGARMEDAMPRVLSRAVAGVLLMIPGVLSDLLALVVLLPPVSAWLGRRLGRNFAGQGGPAGWSMVFGNAGFGGMGPMGDAGMSQGQVFDGEAREVNEEIPQLPHKRE